MASWWSQTVDIDYSATDGAVHSFQYKERMLYDPENGIVNPHWKRVLCAYVKRQKLNTLAYGMLQAERLNTNGPRYPSFVVRLAEDGDLPLGV